MELKSLLALAGILFAAQAAAQVTLYEDEGFRGRFITADGAIANLSQYRFSDRAASVVVTSGKWEACENPGFSGRCVILGPGSYGTLASVNMNWRISSLRPAGDARVVYEAAPAVVAPAPAVVVPPAVTYVRPEDQRFEARVISARAVLGVQGRQCWVEKEQIGPLELPGAIIAGVGDLLTGRQRATYFEHCTTVPTGARPDYWDVTYEFRGIQHNVQLKAPPGPTISVNGNGEMIG
jgi:hypothetical protein